MNRFLAALAAAALLSPAAAAVANPLASESMKVHTGDLDLSTADGQARLHKRVARAAEGVCGADLDRIHLSIAAKARDCRIATIEEWESRNRAALAIAPTVG